jgi:curved DNA-binding protein CbpA
VREKETKRLKRLVTEVKSAPDTPAIISILAEDRELLHLAFRILTIQPAGDPALFQDLDRICREADTTPAMLKKRLTPAARALGLPGPEESIGDFYEVLGVLPGASPAEIRKAYLSKARDLHPDIHPDIKPQEFALLAEAFRVLSSPDLREAYDARHRKVVPDWAERSPVFMEEAEKQTQVHQRKRRGLVVQLGLVLLAMIIGIGIASYLFEQQALREGSSYVQTPFDAEDPATVPKTRPSPTVQLAARPQGVRGQESRVIGEIPSRQERTERRKDEGIGGRRDEGTIGSSLIIERPAVPKSQALKPVIQRPAPAKAPAPVEAYVKPGPASGTPALEPEIPAASHQPSPPFRPKAGSKEKDERLAEKKIFAELEEMALEASRPTPAQAARKSARAEAAETRPVEPVPVKEAEIPIETPKALPPPAVEQPVRQMDQPPLEPLDSSSMAKALNQPEPSAASASVREPARAEPIETRPIEPVPVKQADQPVEPPKAPPRPVISPVVPLSEIQDFIKSYCRAYENLNYARFMGYFAPDAVENDRSVQQLKAVYRENFERLDTLTYSIRVKDCRVKPDEIEVTGDYRLRWRFREDDWREREGPILLGLIPVNASFQVKRLVYR